MKNPKDEQRGQVISSTLMGTLLDALSKCCSYGHQWWKILPVPSVHLYYLEIKSFLSFCLLLPWSGWTDVGHPSSDITITMLFFYQELPLVLPLLAVGAGRLV